MHIIRLWDSPSVFFIRHPERTVTHNRKRSSWVGGVIVASWFSYCQALVRSHLIYYWPSGLDISMISAYNYACALLGCSNRHSCPGACAKFCSPAPGGLRWGAWQGGLDQMSLEPRVARGRGGYFWGKYHSTHAMPALTGPRPTRSGQKLQLHQGREPKNNETGFLPSVIRLGYANERRHVDGIRCFSANSRLCIPSHHSDPRAGLAPEHTM